MGKTYKDTANYHRFHDTDGASDNHVKQKLDILTTPSKCNVGRRLGDDRKSAAKSKVCARRIRRARERREKFEIE